MREQTLLGEQTGAARGGQHGTFRCMKHALAHARLFVCVCLCVCVCERETETENDDAKDVCERCRRCVLRACARQRACLGGEGKLGGAVGGAGGR